MKQVYLKDSTVFDPTAKTALSIRDGVLEYYGLELGIEPKDKIFKVYRSPATTANAAMSMRGIPVTDEHIDVETAPEHILSVGKVESAKMVDVSDRYVGATVAVKNILTLDETILPVIESGKKELSLGYLSNLKEHDEYDFEQVDIMPHHLAIVKDGRCGSMCSFIDKKPEMEGDNMNIFLDANGKPDIKKIKDALGELPDSLKLLDEKGMEEVKPLLDAFMPKKEEPQKPKEGGEEEEGDTKSKKKTMDGKDEPAKFTDEDMRKMVDAQVSKRLADAVARHATVVDKAKAFLGDDFVFAGKTTDAVITAVLEQEYPGQKFSDSQRDFAFDLLKSPERQTADYSKFADAATGSAWATVGDKEV